RRGTGLAAFALWHSAPLADGRSAEELRVLKVAAVDLAAFDELVPALSRAAARIRLRRLTFRCQTADPRAYGQLIAGGYRVHWTDLRMTWRGHPEPTVPVGVLMSNWEI
ncbi:MAG: hypothetical protein ACREL6_10735, partial [Gemmatimonadales bacterium]